MILRRKIIKFSSLEEDRGLLNMTRRSFLSRYTSRQMIPIFGRACISRSKLKCPRSWWRLPLKAQNGAWASGQLPRDALGHPLARATSSAHNQQMVPDLQEGSSPGAV